MSNAPQFTWDCPKCGRHVPHGVNECRCGVRWYEADALRREVEAGPASPGANAAPTSMAARVGRVLVGYRAGAHVPGPSGLIFGACSVVAVVLVGAGTVRVLSRGNSAAPQTADTIRVLSRLDDHTRNAGSRVPNAIPSFIALPGKIGVLADSGVEAPEEEPTQRQIVKEIKEGELQKGVCSPSVPLLVRQQYPGAYDDWPDDRLEQTVLKAHPEYRDRLCVLPAWIDARPHDIVKYEPRSPSALAALPQSQVLLWSTLVTAAVAFALLNVYCRFVAVSEP